MTVYDVCQLLAGDLVWERHEPGVAEKLHILLLESSLAITVKCNGSVDAKYKMSSIARFIMEYTS